MQIIFITPEYVTENNFDGGLANYLYRVCVSLVEFGHKPVIIVGSNKDEKIVHDGVTVYKVNVGNSCLNVIKKLFPPTIGETIQWIVQSKKLNMKLKELCKYGKLDLVQYTSYTATALFANKKIPSIVRISSVQKLMDEKNDRPANWIRNVLYFLELKALKKGKKLICPSKLISNEIQRITSRKVDVVEGPYNHRSEQEDQQPYNDLLQNKKYLLFFGTLCLLKGVKIIAEILSVLLSRHKDLHFVFIGKDVGYNGIPMMQHVWDKSGVNKERCLYLESMKQNQLIPFIKNCVCVVLPSRIDNLPNTCIEAMANQKIVIGTKGASFEQLIDDGSNGFLCEKDNPQDLLLTIEKALSLNKYQVEKIGRKAKNRIKSLYPDISVSKLLNIYKSIM